MAAKTDKGKGKAAGKGKGKKRDKGGPNKFLLIIAGLILAFIMLWVLGVIDVTGAFNNLFNKSTTSSGGVQVKNVEPTGSAPVTPSSVVAGSSSTFVSSPDAVKLAKIYAEMQPQKAADALTQMPALEAFPILMAMDEWRSGIILSKMDAAKTVELTQLIATAYRDSGTSTTGGVTFP